MVEISKLGTNAARIYDALLGDMGAKRTEEADTFIQWEAPSGETAFCVTKLYDGNPATPGNGTMIAFKAGSEDQVNALHA